MHFTIAIQRNVFWIATLLFDISPKSKWFGANTEPYRAIKCNRAWNHWLFQWKCYYGYFKWVHEFCSILTLFYHPIGIQNYQMYMAKTYFQSLFRRMTSLEYIPFSAIVSVSIFFSVVFDKWLKWSTAENIINSTMSSLLVFFQLLISLLPPEKKEWRE